MMPKIRLIASLLIYNNKVVQTRSFRPTNIVGSAITAVDFFNSWSVDEILILDISKNIDNSEKFISLVEDLSRRCFVPLSVGGKINDLPRISAYTRAGADKVIINSHALLYPQFITEASDEYGSQCIIISIDSKKNPKMPSGYEVIIHGGKDSTGMDTLLWAQSAQNLGAGEILINEIYHDGNQNGYDLDLVKLVSNNVDVPVIAFGGVGNWDHLVEGVTIGDASAVAAGNIFHYTEHSTKKAKEYLAASGILTRKSSFYEINMPRLPKYIPF